MTTTEYTVTGMTCAHCERAIREEVGAISGVINVDISAQNGHLLVHSEHALPDAAIIAAVDEAGYAAALASEAPTKHPRSTHEAPTKQ